MKIRVLKFGGTSVANAECLRQVAALVAREVETQESFPVVVLTATLQAAGVSAAAVCEEVIVTEDPAHFRASVGAQPLHTETGKRVRETITPLISRGIVPIVPGFIARGSAGRMTLLGRGGSDW